MNRKFLILDFFVDEPACFGVPHFISPYPRYLFGALLCSGVNPDDIDYMTVETLRQDNFQISNDYELVFIIGGAVVPGKYLGHAIGTLPEIHKVLNNNPAKQFAIGGLISRQLPESYNDRLYLINKDIEKFASGYIKGDPVDDWRTYDELDRWSIAGAGIVARHPEFPLLIAEIESYRGCPRQSHCSFCSETIFKEIIFRKPENILAEINALIKAGVSRFRIGRQADILAYGSSLNDCIDGFPRPNPAALNELFQPLAELKRDGRIRVLNIDNGNPGTIARFETESRQILEILTDALTPGDTLALGVESFDDNVIKANNLKVTFEQLQRVVHIINEIGGRRIDGIPIILPGINLVHGLLGESDKTFRINYEGLLKMQNDGLLIKRINIRKLLPFPGTALAQHKIPGKLTNRYDFYKNKIRDEIDHNMLKAIYPAGTILKDVLIEDNRFDYAYGKQLSSYSITAKIPQNIARHELTDVVVVNQRERSLISLPLPVDVNSLSVKAFELIPGVGQRLASELVLKRPFAKKEDLIGKLPEYIIKNTLIK